MTFADKVISFLENLRFRGSMPEGINIMNPFRDDPRVMPGIVPLEHPGFIMQYKSKQKQQYIRKYITELNKFQSYHNQNGKDAY